MSSYESIIRKILEQVEAELKSSEQVQIDSISQRVKLMEDEVHSITTTLVDVMTKLRMILDALGCSAVKAQLAESAATACTETSAQAPKPACIATEAGFEVVADATA